MLSHKLSPTSGPVDRAKNLTRLPTPQTTSLGPDSAFRRVASMGLDRFPIQALLLQRRLPQELRTLRSHLLLPDLWIPAGSAERFPPESRN